jgi:hypothetical protein
LIGKDFETNFWEWYISVASTRPATRGEIFPVNTKFELSMGIFTRGDFVGKFHEFNLAVGSRNED